MAHSNSTKKTKILIIGPTPPPYYGVANATHIILNSALQKEFNLLYLNTSDRRENLNFGKLDIINVYLALKHICQLVWLIFIFRPAIIYIPISQNIKGYLRDGIFICICALCKVKIVLHLRGAYFRTFYKNSCLPARWFIKKSLSFADRMIVLGESLRYIFSGLIPPEKIYVVPNGIDPLKFKVATLEKRTNGKVRICFLSNLHRTKGFGEVLQAIRILSEKYRIDCTFAGKWINKTDEIETLKYIEKHSLKNIAKFVGTVKGKGKIDLLANSDIFVLPTYFKNEGQPWAILEAMATGLPVISTDHGCIAETVCDSETGFIVPKRDIYALVMKIEILITMNNLRIQMGKKGRLRLASMFTEDKFIHRLNVVFSELL